jgi:hypothetical protein
MNLTVQGLTEIERSPDGGSSRPTLPGQTPDHVQIRIGDDPGDLVWFSSVEKAQELYEKLGLALNQKES